MAADGNYWLGKSHYAGSRLRLQYELTKANFDGHMLDPSIEIKSGMRVIDVATGTGVFVAEMADKYPDAEFVGVDITLDETPPKAWLPPNVSFRQLDLLKDIPEEDVGSYDIVTIQYVLPFVSDKNFKEILEKLLKMLKPGGYLQWTESNPSKYSFLTASGDEHPPELTKLREMTSKLTATERQPREWMKNLAQEFELAGLQDIKFAEAKNKSTTWLPMLKNWLWALSEGFNNILAVYPDKKPVADKWFEQLEKVMIEAKELTVGMNMLMERASGRKPN